MRYLAYPISFALRVEVRRNGAESESHIARRLARWFTTVQPHPWQPYPNLILDSLLSQFGARATKKPQGSDIGSDRLPFASPCRDHESHPDNEEEWTKPRHTQIGHPMQVEDCRYYCGDQEKNPDGAENIRTQDSTSEAASLKERITSKTNLRMCQLR